VSGKYDYTKLRKALDEGMSIVHGETVLLLLADLDAANTNLHTALVAMRSARDERDKYEEEAHAANARADEAEAMAKWLATDDYIAACPSNAPLHRPLVWSKDGSTVLDGGCGGDAGRCQECRLAAAREAVR